MAASGSYVLNMLEHPNAERLRLERQAAVLWDAELAFLRRAGLRPGTRVLDLGCGNGRVAARIAQAEPKAIVVGADRDPTILPKANVSNLSFFCSEAGRLPASLGNFDLIYARFLLQHVADPVPILADASSRLNPAGVIATVDSDDSLFLLDPPDAELDSLLERARAVQSAAGGDRWIGRKLPRLLWGAGLTALSVEYRHLDSVSRPFSECYALATGFKAALLREHAAFARVGARLEQEASDSRRFLSVGICAVVGRICVGSKGVGHGSI